MGVDAKIQFCKPVSDLEAILGTDATYLIEPDSLGELRALNFLAGCEVVRSQLLLVELSDRQAERLRRNHHGLADERCSVAGGRPPFSRASLSVKFLESTVRVLAASEDWIAPGKA